MRGLEDTIAVTSQIAVTLVVCYYEDDVRPLTVYFAFGTRFRQDRSEQWLRNDYVFRTDQKLTTVHGFPAFILLNSCE